MVKSFILAAVAAVMIAHSIFCIVQITDLQRAVMVLEMRVEGLTKFDTLALDRIHDTTRRLLQMAPLLTTPTMPQQCIEYSHPIYKIPTEPINATPGGL